MSHRIKGLFVIKLNNQEEITSWRGYANLILNRTKYVGDGIDGLNRDQIRLGMVDRADEGEF